MSESSETKAYLHHFFETDTTAQSVFSYSVARKAKKPKCIEYTLKLLETFVKIYPPLVITLIIAIKPLNNVINVV